MRIPWFTRQAPVIPHEAQLDGEATNARIEVFSPTWKFIDKWSKDQLAAERERNDSHRLTEVQTAVLRGRIDLLKDLIALPHAGRDQSLPAGILSRHFAGPGDTDG
jgi:hypothetical protein